ncbi:MAG: hypothetical protein K0S28_2226 [Paucimonas sp.]|jgi:hypothetical protein|nr:hypothetical protein [Paucimonas sp.]
MINVLRILACALLVSIACSALAFDRPFPAGTKRAKMKPALYPQIIVDGKPRVFSVGAKIWNPNNLIEMPNSLGAGMYVINYTENANGEIDRVWILTPEEAKRPASSLSTDGETR